MPQLRCAQTSEIIAEGTPLEIATAAEALDPADVLFDDVPPGFDPAAVRKFHAGVIDGLKRSLDELPSRATRDLDADTLKARRDTLKATLGERQDRIDAGKKKVAAARRAMNEARKRRDERAAAES
jgi:hypothetical protein